MLTLPVFVMIKAPSLLLLWLKIILFCVNINGSFKAASVLVFLSAWLTW
ncbi:hypothetical protein RO3G_02136 [Rhizopus delemar RA 99-880]|uniref:Uncharacterized protein n=1 Tax=Rhizopus delemar (strain RA 99-880 / ATCC MYA-4621 / FGSC 9543 / NRRL 43880) TaxID=246409 RepID=I1BMK2_RHIO9|nr:hypothetical protein RO3G_02136 [Rhizopus delemar RA 99-880]|eukprot:EIE77432.1 hypothetical protein RO3G_02136 [Rhizopus delemar RA 99-880]